LADHHLPGRFSDRPSQGRPIAHREHLFQFGWVRENKQTGGYNGSTKINRLQGSSEREELLVENLW
jgi:hypothetical protein